jgi:uncharacterized protein YdeI (YjbR/CyaY-like superfamily)
MKAAAKIPVLVFVSAKAWQQWLAKHHKTSDGIWLRLFKKTSATPSVSYAEALDAALCYGWIDGQTKSHDAQSWLRKFTPRCAKSIWSKKNLEQVARLTKAGKMTAAGLNAVEAAKADGRLKVAYDAPSKSEVPKDFLAALSRNAKAKAFFATLNRANVYAITFRLQTAKKPETREKRMRAILEMLGRGEKFH